MILRAAQSQIVPNDFPELALLAWNRDPMRPISTEDAFALYERLWRHVDVDRLMQRERILIDTLTRRHGNGVLLVAS